VIPMLEGMSGLPGDRRRFRVVWFLVALLSALMMWPVGGQGIDGQLPYLLESLFSRDDFGGLVVAAQMLNDDAIRNASRENPFALLEATDVLVTPGDGQAVLVDVRTERVPVLGQWTPTMAPEGRRKCPEALLFVAEGSNGTRFAIALQPQLAIADAVEGLTPENFQIRLEEFILSVEGGQDNIQRLYDAVQEIANDEEQQDGIFSRHGVKALLFDIYNIELGPAVAAVAIKDAGTDWTVSAMVFSPDPDGMPLEPGIGFGAMNEDGNLGVFFIVRSVEE